MRSISWNSKQKAWGLQLGLRDCMIFFSPASLASEKTELLMKGPSLTAILGTIKRCSQPTFYGRDLPVQLVEIARCIVYAKATTPSCSVVVAPVSTTPQEGIDSSSGVWIANAGGLVMDQQFIVVFKRWEPHGEMNIRIVVVPF